MQEIADRAGINKAMLHYYFRNKEKLYAHIFEVTFSRFAGNLHIIFENDESVFDNLQDFIDAYLSMLQENPLLPIFISRELSEGGQTARETVSRLIEEGRFKLPRVFTQKVREAISAGEIRSLDPLQLLISLIGCCVYFFIAEPLLNIILSKDETYDREKFLEQRRDAIYDLFVRGIAANNKG